MPFVPFLNPSDTYLNYQRPRGFLDVMTAAIVTGLAKDVLLLVATTPAQSRQMILLLGGMMVMDKALFPLD